MGQRYLKEEIYNTIFKKDHRINTQNDYGRSDVTTATMGGAVFVLRPTPISL
ncbi:MAG: hypothetical protein HWD59_06005 [Coxiellaceae bacterium]|nr:MAG: hypothetical protein HWD59_06005 [Coxiellaceae bacterium]